ncbi:hypothetical protein I4U23_024019 [Adineta vaga]|nr:hypothetical protein I4U23_024019 [Adineta vaga]
MANRTPSFVVVGLLLITLLLGFFYMSCSSKTTDLQRTVDNFESRIRTLMVKNSDKVRELDTIISQKNGIEAEKSNLQKQLDKKDSEINDLNSKLNERLIELRDLKADKQVLDQRLKEYQNASNTLASRNFDINRLKQELDERKKSNDVQLNQLKEEIDSYKNKFNHTKERPIEFANQRFRPLLSSNETIQNTSSIFQEPLAKLSNFTNEIKDKIGPVISDIKNRFLNVSDNENHPHIDQNIPAPPLNNDKEQPVRALGRAADVDNQQQNEIEHRQRKPRSFNDSIHGDKRDVETNNSQKILHRSGRIMSNNANIANNLDDIPSQLIGNRRKNRIAKREESQRDLLNKNDQNQVIENEDNNRQQNVRRRNLL